MLKRSAIAPEDVHSTLAQHLLVDGYPIVIDFEHSRGSYLRDAISGREYLDFFSFFASNPIGFNHPSMVEPETQARLARVATTKVSNADYYSTYMAEFVDTFARSAAPPELPHYFFIDGGALAVENAMKAAFDWKVRKNLARGLGEKGHQILHLEHAFHGRSGYTLSVTNTDPTKTLHYPKFDWPRIPSPKLDFPSNALNLERAEIAENSAISAAKRYFEERPDDIAAILIEPIQGEGGDQHFRPEFFRKLRTLADEHEALLIYDEVQTGLGITGKWWAYQHHGVSPDILCFAKKMQVGGIAVSRRIDEVAENVFKVPSRINSTWGASLVDMVRCTRILEIIENENLLENAALRGQQLQAGLNELQTRFPEHLSNARGSGLMCAIDVSSTELRNRIIRQCFEDQVIVLASGRRAIRFRPTLAVPSEAIALGLSRLQIAVGRAIDAG
ncbi:MAG: L-lysine 6-transaminase [Polyangiaceae bacterium]|nr:L-lysine 6-transaminase [Polyangiaceae bacterium]